MSSLFLVALQQFDKDKVQFLSKEHSQSMAESKAEVAYIEKQANMVMVIECDPYARIKEDRLEVVFKLERTCKHPTGLQHTFDYARGTSVLCCELCQLKYGSAQVINELPAEEVTA